MLEVKKTINATYSETDIKRLIVADLAAQKITIAPSDIHVSISGGYADDSWTHYSGGHSPSQTEVVPVKFNGFTVHKEINESRPPGPPDGPIPPMPVG